MSGNRSLDGADLERMRLELEEMDREVEAERPWVAATYLILAVAPMLSWVLMMVFLCTRP